MSLRSELEGKVMTVRGPIDADALGITLPHEHIFMYHTPPELVLLDPVVAAEEVAKFGEAGGGTIVELTGLGAVLRRNPAGLRKVSEQTGVQIVMGTSYYKQEWLPEDIAERSVDSIADEVVRDVTEGSDDSGVRAGIIGEVGIGTMTQDEEKVLQASGRAQRATGAAINIHFEMSAPQEHRMRGLDILEGEGVPLDRVACSHFQGRPEESDYHEGVAERGAYVEFDSFGQDPIWNKELGWDTVPSYEQESAVMRELVDRGYLDKILISSDVCFQQMLTRNGGWGYAHVVTNVMPRLKKNGFTDDEINTITVENPKRLLPVRLD